MLEGDFAPGELEVLLGKFPNVWKVVDIQKEPEILLYDWKIQVMNEGSFFVGERADGTGRVSTEIVTVDTKKSRGVTKSGRVYELVGESRGMGRNAEYVWNIYKNLNKLTDLKIDQPK